MNDGPDSLSRLIDSLTAGETFHPRRLALLSDLGSLDQQRLKRAWAGIPPETRASVLAEAAEIAEANIELDFDGLARIGLTDSDPLVRRLGIEAAWESTDRHVAADLVRLLGSDPDAGVRFAAADALASFVLLREYEEFDRNQGDEIVAALRGRETDPGEAIEVRARALVALSNRSEPWVESLIADAYYDEERMLRLAAIEAMGRTAEQRWLEYIDEQFLSDDPEFRFQAVVSAAEIGSPDSVDGVAALLDDPEPDVALAAVAALGEIGGEEAREQLQAFRDRMPGDYAEAVDEALEAAKTPWRSTLEDERWDEDDR